MFVMAPPMTLWESSVFRGCKHNRLQRVFVRSTVLTHRKSSTHSFPLLSTQFVRILFRPTAQIYVFRYCAFVQKKSKCQNTQIKPNGKSYFCYESDFLFVFLPLPSDLWTSRVRFHCFSHSFGVHRFLT